VKQLLEKEKKFRVGLDFVHKELIVFVVCYCCDVMWVTSCPALTPINTSLKKRREELQEGGEVIVIQDYEGI